MKKQAMRELIARQASMLRDCREFIEMIGNEAADAQNAAEAKAAKADSKGNYEKASKARDVAASYDYNVTAAEHIVSEIDDISADVKAEACESPKLNEEMSNWL